MSVGWGIIGIGRHPDRWMAPAINKAEGSELVAVLSRDQQRAKAFASKHGARRAYTSLDALLQDPEIGAIYVASPNFLHAEHTIAAAQSGKHVLCEKPMALTAEQCKRMIDECRRYNVRLGLGFHLRHHPGLQEARRIIQSGELGQIVAIRAQWAAGERGQVGMARRTGLQAWWSEPKEVGAGAMAAMGVHAVDLIRFLTNEEPVEVVALTDQEGCQPLEWLIQLSLRLRSGTQAHVLSSRIIPDSRNDVVVYGNLGRLEGRDMLNTRLGGSLDLATGAADSSCLYEDGDMYTSQVEAFTNSIWNEMEPNASGIDGLRVCQITLAALRSAGEKRSIQIELDD